MSSWLKDVQTDIDAGDLTVVSTEEWDAKREARLDAEADLIAACFDRDPELLRAAIDRRIYGGHGRYLIPTLERALARVDAKRKA